jgi:hypothetical protein
MKTLVMNILQSDVSDERKATEISNIVTRLIAAKLKRAINYEVIRILQRSGVTPNENPVSVKNNEEVNKSGWVRMYPADWLAEAEPFFEYLRQRITDGQFCDMGDTEGLKRELKRYREIFPRAKEKDGGDK